MTAPPTSGDTSTRPPSGTPTVGVVIPTWNVGETVGAAIHSVVSQDPRPDQVVVVDAGSVDATIEVASAFDGVEIHRQRRRGLGAARNEGIAALTTDLLAFCDGDDEWPEHSLAVRLRRLAEAGSAAVTGHYLPTSGADHSETVVPPQPALTPGGVLFDRQVHRRIGPFSEQLRIGTDTEWFVRLRESDARFDVLPEVVLWKRVDRRASLSKDVARYRSELLGVARAHIARTRTPE